MPSNNRLFLGSVALLFFVCAISCKAKDQGSVENPQNSILGIFSAQGVQEVRSLPVQKFLPWMEQVRGSFLLEKKGQVFAAVSGLGFYDFQTKLVFKPSVMTEKLFGEPFSLNGQTVYWNRVTDFAKNEPGYIFFTSLPTEPDFQTLDAKGPQGCLPLDFVVDEGKVLGHWKNGDTGHVYRYWQSGNNVDPEVYLRAGNPKVLNATDPVVVALKKAFPAQRILIQIRDDMACIIEQSMIGTAPDSVPRIWTSRRTFMGTKILTGTQLLGFNAEGEMSIFDLPLLKPGIVYTDFYLKGDVLYLLWEERKGHLTATSGFLVVEHIDLNVH